MLLHPPVPSHDVLSLLAVLSPQHTRTPDFLCPYPCQTQPQQLPQSARKRRARRSASASTSTSTPFYRSGAVPPKYEQGGDGNWRPASAWTLHGVLHPARTNSPTPSDFFYPDLQESDYVDRNGDGIIDTSDEDSDKYGVNNSSPSGDVAALYDQISASLPTGWSKPPPRTKFYSVPVIIVISLIMAIVVTLLITAVVLTRKTRRRSRTLSDDIEKEADSDNEANQDLTVALKCARKRGKLWERWRRQSQGKLGLRKRWRRPAVRVDESMILDNDPTPRPSFSSSRSRVSSIHPEETPIERDSTDHVLTPSEPPPPPSPPPPIHPPAYQWRRRSLPGTRITSVPLPNALATGSEDQDTLVNGVPLRAHVATDDKTVLEQMRQGASAPEPTPAATVTSSLNVAPHVPLWEDEQLEDFNDDSHSIACTAARGAGHGLHSPLPLPLPSVRYIHRHLDDPEPLSMALYLAEPPAAGPSAPPSDDAGVSLTPSAPPLQDSEEDPRPSAPRLEEDHDVRIGEEEQENGTDPYGTNTEQTGTCTRTEVPEQPVRRPRGRERAQRESVASAVSLPLYEP